MESDHSAEFLVRPVDNGNVNRAARLAAYAMRDNPLHVAAIGDDPGSRDCLMRGLFRELLTQDRTVLGAWRGERLVGVAAYTAPGRCRPTGRQLVALLRPLARFGIRIPRVLRWQAIWARRDPGEPHAHLGPVAVDPEMWGLGIGTRLLREYGRILDGAGDRGYLETDRVENVRFYRRIGFRVTSESDVIGVRNWFMVRDPQTGPGPGST